MTALQLGNPRYAWRNLLSGQAMNGVMFGSVRTVRHMFTWKKNFDGIKDAYEKGAILDDMFNVMQDGEAFASPKAQQFARGALKWTGGLATEAFNRGVAFMEARSMLRVAIREAQNDPLSRKSRSYRGLFQRMGVDGQALIDEGGAGPLTDNYLRRAVNYTQGGYQLDQVPAFMESPD